MPSRPRHPRGATRRVCSHRPGPRRRRPRTRQRTGARRRSSSGDRPQRPAGRVAAGQLRTCPGEADPPHVRRRGRAELLPERRAERGGLREPGGPGVGLETDAVEVGLPTEAGPPADGDHRLHPEPVGRPRDLQLLVPGHPEVGRLVAHDHATAAVGREEAELQLLVVEHRVSRTDLYLARRPSASCMGSVTLVLLAVPGVRDRAYERPVAVRPTQGGSHRPPIPSATAGVRPTSCPGARRALRSRANARRIVGAPVRFLRSGDRLWRPPRRRQRRRR